MNSLRKKTPSAPIVYSTSIIALPPSVFVLILAKLPLADLANTYRVSRRFKVLAYQEEIYLIKLAQIQFESILQNDLMIDKKLSGRDALLQYLQQLPNGRYLPSYRTFLNFNTDILKTEIESPSEMSSLSVAIATPKITSALPEFSHLIIGAGGLKQALANQNKPKPQLIKRPDFRISNGKTLARELFKLIFVELCPYFMEFRERQTDSKVFRDFKDPSEAGMVLKHLKLFSESQFIVDDVEEITFALQTSSEWFESTLLGQFEIAYDENNYAEMKKTAFAAYQLNGGMALVHLFISKNPIFFDTTFNPTLLTSKLPAMHGPSLGYALSDEFAKFMDHQLANCRVQIEIVSKVFVPSVDAMTYFINKVFEDSISEYLSTILAAAKQREDLYVYLVTLASAIYSAMQFVEHIVNNSLKVKVVPGLVKERIKDIFITYTDAYLENEMTYIRKKFKTEIEKWDNRVRLGLIQKKNVAGSPVKKKSYLDDSQKAQEHKRMVMNTMKAIMFAPITLTSMVIGGIGRMGTNKSLLDDVEPIDSNSPAKTVAVKEHTVTYNLDDSSMNSLLSLELALHLMHANKESLGRALVISSYTDITKMYLMC